ncbi:MAG: DUF503 domain-containing protein [Polyangia bacterium]
MVVGVCRVSLMLEESQSLKDKRSVLKRIKDRVSQKFNCAIAEVGDQDVWQSAQLGFAVVSNERGFTQSMVQRILQFIDDLALAKLIDDEQDYVDYGDGVLEGTSEGRYDHWEPAEPSPGKGKRSSSIRPPHKLAAEDYPWDSPDVAPEPDKVPPAARKRDDQTPD